MIRSNVYKRAVFNAFEGKYTREKALVLKLANMAKKFDNAGK
jgi:hypothetical protein